MHLQFYHLNRPPFQLATDPDFFWEGKNYVKSFDVLKYSLEHHGGLSLLTGTAGSGKSMVVRALLNALGNTVRAAVIPDSSLTGQEFYDLVAHEFNLAAGIENREDFHDRIHVLLQEARENNQQVLLVIDEAQQLSGELIDEIGELITLQPVDSGGLGICLVGQADTARDLVTRVSQAFENHVIVRYHLAPFTQDETGKYIQHRLNVAGADRRIFTDDAIREIYHCSGGYPGQINIICDLALFAGYTENAAEIGPALIGSSAAKLQFPGMQGKPEENCPAVTPADLETEDHNLAPEEKNEAGPAAEDVTEAIVAAEAGGRSFAIPALVVLMALVFVGGGYALYMKQTDTQLVAAPAVTDPQPVVDTIAPSVQETGKAQSDFDAVGYSPPSEDNFLLQQPVDKEAVTTAATDPDLLPVEDSLPENAEEVVEEAVVVTPELPQDRLEVQALQVEESLSAIPAAQEVSTPELVDVETQSLQESVPAAVAEAAALEEETETVEVSPVPESVAEESVADSGREEFVDSIVTSAVVPTRSDEAVATVPLPKESSASERIDVETPTLQGSVPAAIPIAVDAGAETPLEEENIEVSLAAPEPVREQQQAMDIETSVADTEQEMEKNTGAPMNRVRKPELEHFFEAGAFVSQASSSPQVIKTTQRARTVGASPKKEIKIKIEPTPQPDPEDVIDWLLKKKEQHAQ